jgi:subtilisin family serine protease
MKRNCLLALGLALFVAACGDNSGPTDTNRSPDFATQSNGTIGINILLRTPATQAHLAELGKYGQVADQIVELNAVQLRAKASVLPGIRALSFVAAASGDVERKIPPHVALPFDNTVAGLNTWNLDVINVSDATNPARKVSEDGTGVYVAVLDTGLLTTWRYFIPVERIAAGFARSFGGGGSENASIPEQPNKWEHDVNGHGTHVTSTITGFATGLGPFQGVAPKALIIPVKVLNQNGSGSSFVVAHGVAYIAGLKGTAGNPGPLFNQPIVINLSLGGPEFDAVEQAALDLAIANGVIIAAAAGNEGTDGLSFPAAYAPVISAAAGGFRGQFACAANWFFCDVPDPTSGTDLFIEDFSSRALAGQDLDVTAPGAWVLGPFDGANKQFPFAFVTGTSEAAPHVAGLAALVLQRAKAQGKTLSQAQVESILQNTAVPIPPGSANVIDALSGPVTRTWGSDATGSGMINAQAALAAVDLLP